MFKNKKISFLFIYFFDIMLKEIICQSHSTINDNVINLKELIQKSFKNNDVKISGLDGVFSKMAQEKNDFFVSSVKLDDINIGNEINLECLKYFELLGMEAMGNFNKLVDINANDNYHKMPEHCKIEYNKITKKISDSFVNKFTSDGKFRLNIGPEGINIDFNVPEEEQVNNFEDKKKNKSYDDELEQYYIKSRKDCVEYGLKSSEEEIIVCTKYE